MSLLWWLCVGSEALAGILSTLLARHERSVRLVALLSVLFVLVDVEISVAGLLLLDDAPAPYEGLARRLYHVETSLLLAQPFAVGAAACLAFAWPREGRVAAGALGLVWASASVALAVLHPLPIGWTKHVLHAGVLAPTFVGLGAVFRARRRPWGRAQILLFLLLGTLLSIGLIGPFSRGQPFNDWDFARVSGAIGFGVVAAFCGAWLGGWTWKSPSSRSERSSRSPSS